MQELILSGESGFWPTVALISMGVAIFAIHRLRAISREESGLRLALADTQALLAEAERSNLLEFPVSAELRLERAGGLRGLQGGRD